MCRFYKKPINKSIYCPLILPSELKWTSPSRQSCLASTNLGYDNKRSINYSKERKNSNVEHTTDISQIPISMV